MFNCCAAASCPRLRGLHPWPKGFGTRVPWNAWCPYVSRRWPGGSRALLVAVQGVRGVPCLRGRALASAGGKGKVGERGPSGCMRRNGVKFRAVQLCRGWRGWKGGEPPRRSSTGAQEPRCALTTQQLVTQGVHVFCNKRSPLGRSGSLGDIGYKGGWSGRWAAAPQTGSWAKGLQGLQGHERQHACRAT